MALNLQDDRDDHQVTINEIMNLLGSVGRLISVTPFIILHLAATIQVQKLRLLVLGNVINTPLKRN